MIKELDKNDLNVISKLQNKFSNVLKDVNGDLDSNPFSNYLLYFIDDEIVGYINYYLIYNRIEIANFNVLNDYQNKHIGTELLDNLINKYTNIDNITLEVKKDNIKAIHLYQKMGFKEVAIRKNYYNGIDGILMERGMK